MPVKLRTVTWQKNSLMYPLDNDTLSLFLRNQDRVVAQVLSKRPEDIWLPAVVLEEQFRGRLTYLTGLKPARKLDSLKIPAAYGLLVRTYQELKKFQILPYTAEAEALYQSWPPAIKRLGTRDCRIAATALVNDYAVVTCNQSHFKPIPVSEWRTVASDDFLCRKEAPNNLLYPMLTCSVVWQTNYPHRNVFRVMSLGDKSGTPSSRTFTPLRIH